MPVLYIGFCQKHSIFDKLYKLVNSTATTFQCNRPIWAPISGQISQLGQKNPTHKQQLVVIRLAGVARPGRPRTARFGPVELRLTHRFFNAHELLHRFVPWEPEALTFIC